MAISSAFNPWIDGRAFRPNLAQQEIIQQKGHSVQPEVSHAVRLDRHVHSVDFFSHPGQQAAEKAPGRLGTDSVVLDIRTSIRNKIEAARQIRNLAAVTKVVIFCMHSSAHIAEQARLAGADPCL